MKAPGSFANLPAEQLARLTFSSVRSAQRWKRLHLAPRLALQFLRLLFDGPLGMISPPWDGWTLRAGKLISPEGVAFTPGEVRSIPLRYQQIRALELERRGPHPSGAPAPA